MVKKEWKEIASADDDMISTLILEWSGLDDLWWNLRMDAHYRFIDVAENCEHIWIDYLEWDANFPGRSGLSCIVSTDDEVALKRELKSELIKLAKESKQLIKKIILEEKQREQDEKRKKAEEEKRLEAIKPDNHKLLLVLYEWCDITPDSWEYHMEYIAGSEPKYRLWKKDRFWEPKDCYVDAELGTKKAAETLLKQYFRKWPDYVDSYDTGEIFDKDELKKIKEEMF